MPTDTAHEHLVRMVRRLKRDFFEYENIRLRPIAWRDLPMTLAWRNLDEHRCWFKDSSVIVPAHHERWFLDYLSACDQIVYIVENRDKQPVGQASIYRMDAMNSEAEIGRFLASPVHSGKGYMKSACGALCEVAYHQLDLHRLYLEVLQDNRKAIHVYAENGFVPCGKCGNLITMEMVKFR